MNLKHRIRINVSAPDEESRTVLTGGDHTIRSRKLSKLLGGRIGVLVLMPDTESVSSVEVCSEGNGGVA